MVKSSISLLRGPLLGLCICLLGTLGIPAEAQLRYLTLDSSTGKTAGIPDVAIMDIDHDSQLEWVYAQRGFNNALVSGKYNGTVATNREEVPLAGLNDAIEPSFLVSGDQNGDAIDDLVIFRGETGAVKVPGFRLIQRDNSTLGSGTGANYASEVGDNTLYAIDADGGKGFNETGTKTSVAAWYAGANESIWSRNTAPIGSGTWCRNEFDTTGSSCTWSIGCLGDWNGDGNTDAARAFLTCDNEIGVRSSNGATSCPASWDVQARADAGRGEWQARTCRISNGNPGTAEAQNLLICGIFDYWGGVGIENRLRLWNYGGTYGAPMVNNPPDGSKMQLWAIKVSRDTRNNGRWAAFTRVKYADLDNDGFLEVLAGSYDGKLAVYWYNDPTKPYRQSGANLVEDLLAEYPGNHDAPVTGIAVADLDNDGQKEILVGSNYPDAHTEAITKTENAIIIDGLENILFSSRYLYTPTPFPTATPTPTPVVAQLKYLTLESQTGVAGVGIPDVEVMDIDHDGSPEIVYAEKGITNSLVSLKYADGPPRQTVREAVPLSSLSNAANPLVLGVGDQNGDGLDDLVISGNASNKGFRLIQRDNAALGTASIANYVSEEEVREAMPFANNIDVGKALNEEGTKTSFAAWYAGWDESIWSRDTAPIGTGTWCCMSFDNAGSGCEEAVGCLGDFNGDGYTDGVRAYQGCGSEVGVRGNLDDVPGKPPHTCVDLTLQTPNQLDRCTAGMGRCMPRCCRISDGSVNTPTNFNVLLAANATTLAIFEYEAHPWGTPPTPYGEAMPADPVASARNATEIVFTDDTAVEGVNGPSVARFGDLDGDGILEIVMGTFDGRLIAFYRSDPTSFLAVGYSRPTQGGYWVRTDLLSNYNQAHDAPITGLRIADLDNDQQAEIVISSDSGSSPSLTTNVIVIDGLEAYEFSRLAHAPEPTSTPTPTPPPADVHNWKLY